MGTDTIRLFFLGGGVSFCIMAITMAKSHLMNGRYIILDLNFLIFILFFRFFFYSLPHYRSDIA